MIDGSVEPKTPKGARRSLKEISYSLAAQFLELFLERRDDLKKVAHDAEARHFEDRRVRILVYSHNHLGGGHPGKMLNRACGR